MDIEVQEVRFGDELFTEVLKLRYHVYCLERGFEDPSEHPEGLETDKYDPFSVHLAAFDKANGNVVGTMRLILHSEKGFPIEKNFKLNSLPAVNPELIGEISRLAVPKQNRHEFAIITQMFQKISSISREYGVTHWYAGMAKGLAVLLRKRKIVFQPAGPEVNFHGLRTPHFGAISQILFGSDFYPHYLGCDDVKFSKLKSSSRSLKNMA